MRESVPQMTVLRQRISRAKDLLDHTEEEKSLDDVSKTIQSIKDIMKIAQQIAADLRRALHNSLVWLCHAPRDTKALEQRYTALFRDWNDKELTLENAQETARLLAWLNQEILEFADRVERVENTVKQILIRLTALFNQVTNSPRLQGRPIHKILLTEITKHINGLKRVGRSR